MFAPISTAPDSASPTIAGLMPFSHGEPATHVVSSQRATSGIDGASRRTIGSDRQSKLWISTLSVLPAACTARQDDIDEFLWAGRGLGLAGLDFRFDVVSDVGSVGVGEREYLRQCRDRVAR